MEWSIASACAADFAERRQPCAAIVMSTCLSNATTYHIKGVASLLVALYLTAAVSDPDKGAWILQQAHDLCLWQLSVALVI